ncbi:hypothetical protein tb265_42650 [Gemmatimonadetes bacterium T265]|nr:hypothetical protein tb265_42650 [Gemmatimonadetes bacterium T265]
MLATTTAAALAHRARLLARYDALWDAAAPEVRAGRAALDPWAARQGEDRRRGVTLLARLDRRAPAGGAPTVADALGAFCDELRVLEPAAYYQPRADLHLTVLAPFTATADCAPYLAHLDAYRAAAAEAVEGVAPFAVDLVGVTLSPAAVLAQGYPRDGALEQVRARFRDALAARGLGDALDRRYRLETAHVTLVRFPAALDDPARFVGALAAARARPFGTAAVAALELVVGNWYHAAAYARPVATYALAGDPRDGGPRPNA